MKDAAAKRKEIRGADDVVKLAAFRIGEQEYAIDIMKIKEIVNPLPITRVPKAPPFVEGMVELRGAILPIVDLRRRFEAPAAPPTRATKYVNVTIEGQVVGLIVDAVSEVLRVARSDIRPAPAMVSGEDAGYLIGVIRQEKRILMILDIDRILSSAERLRLADFQATAAPEEAR